MFYTTISLIKYLCKYYRNCGGHHDSDRIAVLVMVSKAESIVLYLSSCIMYRPTCQNKDFLPSFLPSHATIFGSSLLHPG